MKKFILQFLSIAIVSLVFSGFGYACALSIAGGQANHPGSSFSCTTAGEDANYCYYTCKCTGGDWAGCDALMADFGLTDV